MEKKINDFLLKLFKKWEIDKEVIEDTLEELRAL